MKAKYIFILLVGILFCSCSKFTGSKEPLYIGDEISTDKTRNVLVAYFSRSGNTEQIANAIATHSGVRYIVLKEKILTGRFQRLCVGSKIRIERQRFPALKDTIADFDKYDVIFVGGPVWWHTAPCLYFLSLKNPAMISVERLLFHFAHTQICFLMKLCSKL